MYFLDRWGPEGETSIEPIDELDPERLLAASYNFAIRTPERMLRQLDVCARLATTVDLYQVTCPPSLGAARLAAEVAEHAASG